MKLFYCSIFLAFSFVNSQAPRTCYRDEFGLGIVVMVKDCDHVKMLGKAKKIDQVLKLREGKEGNVILFCCPARKAQKACFDFDKKLENPFEIAQSIIGGYRVQVGEFPHFAALAYIEEGQLSFDCGGVLISEKFVLTAAHCCSKVEKPPIIVRLGKV